MADYQNMITPPVFWPMLLYVAAGSHGWAGHADKGLRLIATALDTVGGTEADRLVTPELTLLQGDLLRASGSSDEGVAAWERALAAARRLDVPMTELRALTRLVGVVDGAERASLVDQLRTAHARFTEGFDTADLQEAQAALAE
jgi:hypothetical protein